VVSFGVVTVLFALLYKILPDAKISWSNVWVGAAVTSLLFSLGKYLIGLYLGKAGIGSSYGAAGSVLIVLIWVYYSAMILYFGAEFTKVNADEQAKSRPAAA
jgi:membrane protein